MEDLVEIATTCREAGRYEIEREGVIGRNGRIRTVTFARGELLRHLLDRGTAKELGRVPSSFAV